MLKNNLFVSVIVPCYNANLTIIETLASVHAQTYEYVECLIVDDGSTDDTVHNVEKYIDDKNNFRLIKINNSGVSNARNTGIRESKGRYILPLDSDDLIDNTFIEKFFNYFNENQDLKLVYSEGLLFGDENGLWNLPVYNFKKMLHYNMVGNSSMFLKEDFERVGGYRENMTHGLEDWDFWIALLSIYDNEQVYKIDEPLFHYRVSNSSRRLTLIESMKFDKMLQNIVFNNFDVYNSHFPGIHNRILSYDYNSKMLEKWPVRILINGLNLLNKIKLKLMK